MLADDWNRLTALRLYTEPEPKSLARKLQHVIRQGDWLCVFGGDGTINDTVSAMFKSDSSGFVRQTPVVTFPGGNANDISHMLHSDQSLRQPQRILREGRIASVTPLRCEIASPDGTASDELAIGYAGFGATARAAYEIHIKRHEWAQKAERLRIFYAGFIAIRGMLQSKHFREVDSRGVRTAFEHLFVNGSGMSGFLQFPIMLTDRHAEEFVIAERSLPAFGAFIGRSILGKLNGITISPETPVTFRLLDEVFMQRDGEPSVLSAGTTVSIGLHDQSFNALTTKTLP